MQIIEREEKLDEKHRNREKSPPPPTEDGAPVRKPLPRIYRYYQLFGKLFANSSLEDTGIGA